MTGTAREPGARSTGGGYPRPEASTAGADQGQVSPAVARPPWSDTQFWLLQLVVLALALI